MDDLMLSGVLMAPVIVAVIEAAKVWLKLPANYAPVLNGVLSVAVYALMLFSAGNPELATWITYGVNALLYFLVAGGFYELTKPTLAKVFNTGK